MLITLETYQNQFTEGYAWLAENARQLPIHDDLILSALGARICYSSDHPLDLLFNDKRITDPEERLNFLDRCYKAGHFSVFAHSPVMYEIKTAHDIPGCVFTGALYKLWNHEMQSYCANVRHLAEALSMQGMDFKEVFKEKLCKPNKLPVYWGFILWIDENGIFDVLKDSYVKSNSGVLCLFINQKPWQWFSFIVHGYSRIFSHQLVRHTWLNFSQRSHRYTEIDDVVVPPSFKKKTDLEKIFKIDTAYIMASYENRIELDGIPKEDARFITPAGSATTIMASGPRFVWEDFVSKRNHPKAQWEIRKFAQIVEKVLEMTKEG